MKAPEIREYPDYSGAHTREEAPGAIRNGSRVRKVASEPGDAHLNGDLATVLGSVHVPEQGYGYFVEWDSAPRCAVLVRGTRVEQAEGAA